MGGVERNLFFERVCFLDDLKLVVHLSSAKVTGVYCHAFVVGIEWLLTLTSYMIFRYFYHPVGLIPLIVSVLQQYVFSTLFSVFSFSAQYAYECV